MPVFFLRPHYELWRRMTFLKRQCLQEIQMNRKEVNAFNNNQRRLQ